MAVFENPLDELDFNVVLEHGHPNNWRFIAPKFGSPTLATYENALPDTMKHYDLYENAFGEKIEIHYFRLADGTVSDVKVKSRS